MLLNYINQRFDKKSVIYKFINIEYDCFELDVIEGDLCFWFYLKNGLNEILKWNLEKSLLSEQSEELINFLYETL